MKSMNDLIDEFIESTFRGEIITVWSKDADGKGGLPIFFEALRGAENADQISEVISNRLADLYQKHIPSYLASKSEEREQLALKIFQIVFYLRFMGALQNNPNNLKELEYYKAENTRLKEELHKKGVLITELYAQLEGQRVPPDKKELKF